ncbi:MAG: TetR/AcrR family transcriptional regulator [Gammaproteobacteria bacterium]
MNRVIEKDELVRIAAGLFRQKGYAGTSIDDIARGCGLTKGSLYHHFSGKEELALAALAQVHAHYRESIFALIDDVETPRAPDLARFNAAVEAFFAQHPYGCLLANLSLEMGGAFELFKSPIQRFFDDWTACYQKVYAQYLDKAAARAQAQDALAVVQGCVLMYRIHGSLAPLQRQHALLVKACRSPRRAA